MFNISCNYQIIIDKENEFIARVKPSEKFQVETINAYGERFENIYELMKLISHKNEEKHHHPLTGPIYIENAMPGDVIKVHIYKINIEEMGQSLSRTAGIEPIRNSDIENRAPIIPKRISENEINYNGMKLEYKPMIGIVATTPNNGKIKTGHASLRNGGNLDLPFVTEYTDIYLPVDIEGAGLYLGDVHGAQGYGELSGIALEASSKIVIDVEVLKPKELFDNILIIGKEPFSQKDCIGIVGIGGIMKIEDAIKDAFQGSYNVIKQLIPEMKKNRIKTLITVIGNSFNGQAFSTTSESTSMIVITKDDIKRISKKEIEKVLFYF